MDFRSATFVKSVTSLKERPEDTKKEIIFIGRSNVGKSSLLNALCDNRSLAFTSSKPGHTRLLNYFSLKNGIYFVDAPGYGYSKAGQDHALRFGTMMEEYFKESKTLYGVIFLLDSRREIEEEDRDLMMYIQELHFPLVICMTKCDKLNQKEKALMNKRIVSALGNSNYQVLYTSIRDRASIEKLRLVIAQLLK